MLSLIGGLLIFLIGLVIYAFASLIAFAIGASGAGDVVPGLIGFSMTISTMGIIGIVSGLLVMVFGVLMLVMPRQHVIWGVLVLVLSVVSILAFGGLILGMILGIVGGILGIIFKPPAPVMAPAPMPSPPQ